MPRIIAYKVGKNRPEWIGKQVLTIAWAAGTGLVDCVMIEKDIPSQQINLHRDGARGWKYFYRHEG